MDCQSSFVIDVFVSGSYSVVFRCALGHSVRTINKGLRQGVPHECRGIRIEVFLDGHVFASRLNGVYRELHEVAILPCQIVGKPLGTVLANLGVVHLQDIAFR